MKRIAFLFFVTLCFVSAEAIAQTAYSPQTPQPQVGLRVGGNFAQLRGRNDAFGDDTDRKLGLTAGAFVEVPLNASFSLQPELLYVQKGGAFDESFAGDNIEGDFELDYIELPLLLEYNVPVGGRIAPSIYAGPYAAYNIRRDIGFDDDDVDFDFEADDTFRRMNYGAVFGVDFGYRMAGRAATIGARYDLGLSNVFDDDLSFSEGGVELDGPEARAHELSIMLGITL